MSNKTQLQANNVDLSTALTNIQGLPMVDSVKHGLYVWAKYTIIPPVTVTNPSFTVVQNSGSSEIQIINANFDLTKVEDYTFFIGFKDPTISDRYYFHGTAYPIYRGDAYTDRTITKFTATSQSTGTLSTSQTRYLQISSDVIYEGEKIIICEKHMLEEYVVSDDPYKYPDGGTQGGRWYERVKTSISELGVEWGIVTPANSPQQVKVEHSLGVKPSFAQIMLKGWTLRYADAIVTCGDFAQIRDQTAYSPSITAPVSTNEYSADAQELVFKSGSSGYKNAEYIWFAVK